jgi:hypothetical protein
MAGLYLIPRRLDSTSKGNATIDTIGSQTAIADWASKCSGSDVEGVSRVGQMVTQSF